MKHLLVILSIVTATLHLSPAIAQEAKSAPKIVVVNIQEIMRDSTAAKSVREQLEKKQKDFQEEITQKEKQLKKEDEELGKQKAVLSKEAFEKKADAFRKKAAEMQKEVQSKKALLDSGFEAALNDIQSAVNEVIKELAKEKGFDVAIPSSQILFSNESLNVSDEVLKNLNKKLPKVTVKFEAKK